MTRPTTVRRLVAFNIVGVAGFGVQLVTLWCLVGIGHLPCVVASAMAVETAIVHNFICHSCWTWSDRVSGRRDFLLRLLRFNATSGAVSLAVTSGLMAWLEGRLGVHYLAANLVGVVCAAGLNFVLGDRVVFRAPAGGPRVTNGVRRFVQRPKTRAISSRAAGSSTCHRPATSI